MGVLRASRKLSTNIELDKSMIRQDAVANEIYKSRKVRPIEPVENVTFVTTLTESYIPGFNRLIETLDENSGIDYDFVVIDLDSAKASGKLDTSRVTHLLGINDVLNYFAKVGKTSSGYRSLEERVINEVKSASDRFKYNFAKCLMWGLPNLGRSFFIDADIICTGNLEEIKRFPPNITAVRNFALKEGSRRAEMSYKKGDFPIFNTGFFSFCPNRNLHDELMEFMIYGYTSHRNTLGDQPIINDFFQSRYPAQIQYAPYKFNYRCHLRGGMGSFPDEQEEFPALVHFIHAVKPWDGETRIDQRVAQRYFNKEITIEEYKNIFSGPDPYTGKELKGKVAVAEVHKNKVHFSVLPPVQHKVERIDVAPKNVISWSTDSGKDATEGLGVPPISG